MKGLFEGRKILVVEDEMLVLMSVNITLEDLGCTDISVASNVAAALALVARNTFDAALLDVNLGSERSYPVAEALLQLGIPFAFSTGYGDLGDRPDLATRPLLRKPYFAEDIGAVFKTLLEGD